MWWWPQCLPGDSLRLCHCLPLAGQPHVHAFTDVVFERDIINGLQTVLSEYQFKTATSPTLKVDVSHRDVTKCPQCVESGSCSWWSSSQTTFFNSSSCNTAQAHSNLVHLFWSPWHDPTIFRPPSYYHKPMFSELSSKIWKQQWFS